MNALTTSNLEDTLQLEKKPEATSEYDWDKMNRITYSLIRSCLTQDIKYHMFYETSARQLWEILEKKYLTKSIESWLQLKRKLYRFQIKRELSIDEYMNNCTKLLIDLVNVDVKIDKENKAVILLNSLPDEEYENFTLTLINGRQTLNYNKVSAALVNYEVRRQDSVTPQFCEYGDVTMTYIRRSGYPHIYTLSISTCKNLNMKVRGALYIPIYEYNYKVITRRDTILQEYYIIHRRNCKNTKRYTMMNSTKCFHELQK